MFYGHHSSALPKRTTVQSAVPRQNLEAHLKSTRCKRGCVTCYMCPAGAVMGQDASMVGSKAANGGQVKTGQRMWPGTQDVLPCRSHIRQAYSFNITHNCWFWSLT